MYILVNGFRERLAAHPYTDLRSIIREVIEVESIFRRFKMPIIDISHLTIEEIAMKVLEAQGLPG